MGLNVIKFAVNDQYRALKRWKWQRGNDTLLTDFEFEDGDTVIEGGCYLGEFTRRIAACGKPHVIGFEPISEFFDQAKNATQDLANVEVHCAGLSDRNAEVDIHINGEGSSAYKRQGNAVKARMRCISDILTENGDAALLALNVEGEEFAIIEKLISAGEISRIKALVVQFHLVEDDSRARYDAISRDLEKSHNLTWRYPFIWERWDLKS
jgi:FkbM family methyltransferase